MKLQVVSMFGAIALGLSVAAWSSSTCAVPKGNSVHGGTCYQPNGYLTAACTQDTQSNGYCASGGNVKCATMPATFTPNVWTTGTCAPNLIGLGASGTCVPVIFVPPLAPVTLTVAYSTKQACTTQTAETTDPANPASAMAPKR